MLTLVQLNNLRNAAKNAYQCELATKVPCELTLSQWALESGWGAHSPGNNCFGIKGDTKSGQLLHTYEYFTPEECTQWLGMKQGRTGSVADATPRPDGKLRYFVEDWFAVFATLALCFIARARLFQTPRYLPLFTKFNSDNNFVALVQAIGPIYATDPNYAKEVLSIASIPQVQAAIKEVRAGVQG